MNENQINDNFIAELREAMADKSFPTIESFRAFVDVFMRGIDRHVSDDLCGLSPDQMHKFLHAPFDSPGLIDWQDHVPLSVCSDSPLMSLFLMLVDAIGEKGLKPTAKGNLPRVLCRELAAAYRERFFHADDIWFGPVNTETDFYELHVVRIVGELAGLIRSHKGRIVVSRKCRQLIKENNSDGLYMVLLEAYMCQFNWSYWDGYPELPFVQHGFLFTLYLLMLFGDQYRYPQFYADAFLQAFPDLLYQLPEPGTYERDPVSQFISLFEMRCLRNFVSFAGLAELRFEPNPNLGEFNQYVVAVRSTLLLKTVLKFNIWNSEAA